MDSDFLPALTPVQVRDSVLAQETELRTLVKDLHPGGHFEARCLVREAADRLLEAGRVLAAELPGRPPGRPAPPPALHIAQ